MKATLHFDLDEPFEREAHMRCVKSTDLALVIFDMLDYFRTEIKYKDNEDMEPARAELYEIMEAHGIVLDDLLT